MCLYAWCFGQSASQSGAKCTAKTLVSDGCYCHLLIWCVLSVVPLSPSVLLWSSSSLSSLRKIPSLLGPGCKCFIFHPPTNPLCSTSHLAVIFQHLKAITLKYEWIPNRRLQTLKRYILPSSSSLPHGQKQNEEKSRCLLSVDQHTHTTFMLYRLV